jgi:hypothetical protein
MPPEDERRRRRRIAALPSGTRLQLTLTRHPQSDAFQDYGRRLKALAPGIDLVTEMAGEEAPPWMETADGIRFHALPEGDKLDSLTKALAASGTVADDLSPAHGALLDRMPLPAAVRLFIAPGCPHCPTALTQWITLAKAGDQLRLHVIDAVLFPETARAEGIKAVPTLVVDEQLRWTGRIPVAEVLEQLVSRDPSRLSAEALDGIIKEGLAGQVARSMIDSGTLFPAIADLLTHDKWPVRLGAMVVMEEIAAKDRGLAAELLPTLRQRFDALADAVRGDVLYIIGETADRGMLPFLQDVVRTSTHAEVRQAAQEAVAAIQERSSIGSAKEY